MAEKFVLVAAKTKNIKISLVATMNPELFTGTPGVCAPVKVNCFCQLVASNKDMEHAKFDISLFAM